MKTCYMCESDATSKEHVPPKCFFPEKKDIEDGTDYRQNLITVPSCDAHNSSRAKDDEYTLAVIVTSYKNNSTAQQHFTKKIMRSFKRRISLPIKIMQDSEQIDIDGKESRAIHIEESRFNRVMENCARGIHFHHFGEKWTEPLSVLSVSLRHSGFAESAQLNMITIDYEQMAAEKWQDYESFGNNPDVFFYQTHGKADNGDLVIRMVFYRGFEVVALRQIEE
jgi:hypothetical protein